jgi:hypothetical protein
MRDRIAVAAIELIELAFSGWISIKSQPQILWYLRLAPWRVSGVPSAIWR